MVTLYRQHVQDSEIRKDIRESEGKTLLCHCSLVEACHGGVLLHLLEEDPGMKPRELQRQLPRC